MTHLQRRYQVGKTVYPHTGNFGKPVDILPVCHGIFHRHSLVGAPCWEHLYCKALLFHFLMVLETVNRVICRTHHFHIVVLHETACRVRRHLKHRRTMVVNLTCGRGVQQFLHSESRFKLQMRPVVKRIPHTVGHGLGPFLEFFPVCSVFPRAVTLLYPVGAHGAPFVMVPFKPYFREILELMVRGHILGIKMAVVIYDRQPCRIVMI